jgi:hypothetical protein
MDDGLIYPFKLKGIFIIICPRKKGYGYRQFELGLGPTNIIIF